MDYNSQKNAIWDYTPCQKTVACLIFYNLKKLKPILIIFGTLYFNNHSF